MSMTCIEAIANAAKNLALTYDDVVAGYTAPANLEADLASLEEAIGAYRRAQSDMAERA
jgi:hypothetical protein